MGGIENHFFGGQMHYIGGFCLYNLKKFSRVICLDTVEAPLVLGPRHQCSHCFDFTKQSLLWNIILFLYVVHKLIGIIPKQIN